MPLRSLIKNSIVYENLDKGAVDRIVVKTVLQTVDKGHHVFRGQEECTHFYMVANGLVKVYASSTNGTRMTYLLAGKGEPLNLITPFVPKPRQLTAEALKQSVIAGVANDDFLAIAADYPKLVANIVAILGNAIDSANSRIIDMMEKKVDERLFRALYSLYHKFGSPLNFTSLELANLVGATTESVIRSMGRLKRAKVIESTRGRVTILDPGALERYGIDSLWI